MGIIDSLRKRRSTNFETPPRMPTPGLFHRRDSSMSRLTKEEIDEILESPYETNYTYSDSVAYKPHIGSREYIHPRLCRRFPVTPSPKTQIHSASAWSYRSSILEWYHSVNITRTLFEVLRILIIFTFSAMQMSFTQISTFLYYSLRFISIKTSQAILMPILWPYYAMRSYYYRARFVWHTTKSIWTFMQWTWYYWTGQKMPEDPDVGVKTRSMAAHHQQILEEKTTKKRNYAALLLLLLLLVWGAYRYNYPKHMEKMQHHVEEPEHVIQHPPPPIEKPKTQPSDLHLQPHIAHPIGGPPLNVQEEVEIAHHEHEHPPHPAEYSQIGGRYLDNFLLVMQPLSRFAEKTAEFGQITANGIEDIFLAFFTAVGEVAIAIARIVKNVVVFILNIPLHIITFIYQWICLPLGHISVNLAGNSWKFICSQASKISNLPSTFWSFIRKWIISPCIDFFEWIGSGIRTIPSSNFSSPFQYMGEKLKNIRETIWNGMRSSGEYCIDKTSQFYYFAQDAIVNIFSKICQIFLSIWHSFINFCSLIKDYTIKIIFNLFTLIGQTGEKVLDCFVWVKDGIVYSFGQAGNGVIWIIVKVEDVFKMGIRKSIGFATEFGHRVDDIFWLIQEKVSIFFTFIAKTISMFFVNIYQYCTSIVSNIWQNAKEYQFPNISLLKEKEQVQEKVPQMETIERVLSRSPEIGELPDDHPLMQRIRQIILQAFNEERHFVDQRIRKWVEHNVLVMKFQLQRLEPKIVEETKEKVEAEIFPPPPISEEELKEGLRAELEAKIREMLKNERTEEQLKLQKFGGKLEQKVDQFITQISNKIHSENTKIFIQIDQLKREQREFMERSEKEMAKAKKEMGEPIVKQEKLIEKAPDGKEVTRETTVLLQHIKKQIEEFDERALMDKVRKLIKEELRRYDADRTGMPDYALESSGGSVLSTRCTVQYNERSRTQKIFGIPLWYTSYSPRTVIQRKGYGASAGECWAYHGGHGFLTVGLSKRINVTAVSYEHLPKELSLDGHIRSAPKNFLVWSYQEVDDINTRMLLGNFTYDAQSDPLQIFPVQQSDNRLTQIIELETLTNWGASVTCLYRFRVHGDSMRVIPEAMDEAEMEEIEAKLTPSGTQKMAKSVAEEHDIF